jgi:YVTN family beta-propeller protein
VSSLYVCNEYSDNVSKVSLDDFSEDKKILLNGDYGYRIGPHDICEYKDYLICANNFSNSISIIKNDILEENYFIGMHCNDVRASNDLAYVLCGELNSIVVFDMIKRKIIEELPCGNFPHSLKISNNKKYLLVTNMQDDTISIINIYNYDENITIKVGPYPTKAVFTEDNRYIYVCESNLGADIQGSMCIIAVDDFTVKNRITLGYSPVDIFTENNIILASNFGDGTISVIDPIFFEKWKDIFVGGMPKGIVKFGKYAIVGDNYNNVLIKIDIFSESKKVITIGKEPTGMTLSNH